MSIAYLVRPNTRTVRTLSNLGICFEGWAGNMGEGTELVIKEFFSLRNEGGGERSAPVHFDFRTKTFVSVQFSSTSEH